eukprot:411029-Rhodomonas_salina.4
MRDHYARFVSHAQAPREGQRQRRETEKRLHWPTRTHAPTCSLSPKDTVHALSLCLTRSKKKQQHRDRIGPTILAKPCLSAASWVTSRQRPDDSNLSCALHGRSTHGPATTQTMSESAHRANDHRDDQAVSRFEVCRSDPESRAVGAVNRELPWMCCAVCGSECVLSSLGEARASSD